MPDLGRLKEASDDRQWCYEAVIFKYDSDLYEEIYVGSLSFNTEWVGFADEGSRVELRQPRLIEKNGLLNEFLHLLERKSCL